MKRVFAAIVPARGAIDELAAHISELRAAFPHVRASWVRPENIHLTLHFAGDLDDVGLRGFQGHVEAAAAHSRAFGVRLGSAGAFVDKRMGRSVLWAGLDETGEDAGTMANAVAGIRALEDGNAKRFVPHLTLARVRGIAPPELLEANRNRPLAPVEFYVSEFVVFESELAPGGSVYTVLSRHKLG